MIGRGLIREVDQDGQNYYALANPKLARLIIEEWEDDNGMLVRGLVFPNEVEFDAYYAKRLGVALTEDQQVPMPPEKDEEHADVEIELENPQDDAVITQNVKNPDNRFIARAVFLLTKKYNDSTATLNGLLERLIDTISDVKVESAGLTKAVKVLTDTVTHRIGEIEKKAGGYNKRLEGVDRHITDLASAVRTVSQRSGAVDTGQVVSELREVLEPLLTQQKPEKLAEVLSETMTELVAEVQKNTAAVQRVAEEQNQRQKTMKLIADSLNANMKEAESLRDLLLECGDKG
jgi:hypothetical protein